jgi:hypothetical protein
MKKFQWKTAFFESALGSLVTAMIAILVTIREGLAATLEKTLTDNMAPGKGLEPHFTSNGAFGS